MLKRCEKDKSDIYLAMLNYRNTPRDGKLDSPNQRLYSRTTRSVIPSTHERLQPRIVPNVHGEIEKYRTNYKKHADKKSKPSKEFSVGDRVRIQTGHREWISGQIEKKLDIPRSFILKTDDNKLLRRNSIHICPTTARIPIEKSASIVPRRSINQESYQRKGKDMAELDKKKDVAKIEAEMDKNHNVRDGTQVIESSTNATSVNSEMVTTESRGPAPARANTNGSNAVSKNQRVTRYGRIVKPVERYVPN